MTKLTSVRALAMTAICVSGWCAGQCGPAGWAAIGANPVGYIESLGVYQGELIAGGSFTSIGGTAASAIARWNGVSWQTLGSGMAGLTPQVMALTVYNGDLIAGGDFNTAGGVTANGIARWNGVSWQPLGSGMSGPLPQVQCLTVYNGE